MSTVEMPASGRATNKGAPDGVSGTPGNADTSGRTPGGESGGGGYDNPHTGKKPTNSGFMGHGGQTEIDHHGGGQAGEQGGEAPNATTGSDSADGHESGTRAWTSPTYESHPVSTDGRTFEVVETNGVVQAELLGKIGSGASYDEEQQSPGSG